MSQATNTDPYNSPGGWSLAAKTGRRAIAYSHWLHQHVAYKQRHAQTHTLIWIKSKTKLKFFLLCDDFFGSAFTFLVVYTLLLNPVVVGGQSPSEADWSPPKGSSKIRVTSSGMTLHINMAPLYQWFHTVKFCQLFAPHIRPTMRALLRFFD